MLFMNTFSVPTHNSHGQIIIYVSSHQRQEMLEFTAWPSPSKLPYILNATVCWENWLPFSLTCFNQLWNCLSLFITSVHPKTEVGTLAEIKTRTCLIAGKQWFLFYLRYITLSSYQILLTKSNRPDKQDLSSLSSAELCPFNHIFSVQVIFSLCRIFSTFLVVCLWSARNVL
jgi:hypothetical protein